MRKNEEKGPRKGSEINQGFITINGRVFDLENPAELEQAHNLATSYRANASLQFKQALEAAADAEIRLNLSRSNLMRCTRRVNDIKGFAYLPATRKEVCL